MASRGAWWRSRRRGIALFGIRESEQDRAQLEQLGLAATSAVPPLDFPARGVCADDRR